LGGYSGAPNIAADPSPKSQSDLACRPQTSCHWATLKRERCFTVNRIPQFRRSTAHLRDNQTCTNLITQGVRVGSVKILVYCRRSSYISPPHPSEEFLHLSTARARATWSMAFALNRQALAALFKMVKLELSQTYSFIRYFVESRAANVLSHELLKSDLLGSLSSHTY